MFTPGLVSITFRKLSPREIVDLCVKAGVEAIEWGGDVHVPHGELETAKSVRALTEEAGLVISSYGSYYRVGESEKDGLTFRSVLDTALELGSPLIRVWAGKRGSEKADDDYFAMVIDETRRIADLAATENVSIAHEFHANTLTDTNASTRLLLENANRDGVFSYWQPPAGSTVDYCLDGIQAVLPWLTVIHVFHWMKHDRLPLADGIESWNTYLSKIRESGRDHYALLEFVRNDDPEQFLQDAETLKEMI